MNSNHPFERFLQAQTETAISEFQEWVQQQGYSTFRLILEGIKDRVKQFEDEQIEEIQALLQKAKQIFPNPGRFSPAWGQIWHELEQQVRYKIEILNKIPKHERDGEWQILLDNPYTNQEIVCYPELTFIEAAYLYGYFRPQLERNEYIRIQKIQTLVLEFGS